ncbi:MAG: hypothetical protein KO318_09530 [Methanobacterium sp.]|jgi:hypothetical protein|uniref:hypothetical protein n=1 Tax=Methanobacterium sp. TaxID=2164 RepID=UPI002582FA94|nr:hypothetical protein [Methanobacterium sp.]MCC7560649.1 hypothetical protein [Methanobacterium sp.]
MKFYRAIDYNLKKTLKELKKQDIEGLESILQKIQGLKELEIYGKMYEGSVLGKKMFALDAQLIVNEKNQNSLITIGFKDLGKFPFYIPPFSDLISFNNLNALYTMILLVYYAHVERELGYNDLQNVYLSGLDNRIIHAMDEFEKTSNVPETDEKYLISLKSLCWENSDAKKLFKKLNYMKSIICQERFRIKYQIGIQRAEDKFILFAAGCNTVNSERDEINENDIIKGYKTYFKLISTDITKYKATSLKIGVENSDNGYLVCDKCLEYYKLQPGESLDDFIEECECGGRLKYHYNIDWLN